MKFLGFPFSRFGSDSSAMFAFRMKHKLLSIAFSLPVLYCLLAMLAGPGCANIVPPTGGPRDSTPPLLVNATPDTNSRRFDARNITLQFNEFVQLDNLQQELIINPPAERQPDVLAKLRTITIRIKDTLQPNTTYSYRFGKAIRDINEGNALKDFTYVFSTGNYIDSLTLGGTVLDAQSGLPDSTLIVLLHSNPDDSAVAKEKPRYATRPNGKGFFLFENLPPGRFYLFALKDEGFRRYSSNKTPFAFHGPALDTRNANDSIVLKAFVAEKEPEKKATTAPGGPAKRKDEKPALRVTAGASEGQAQDLLSPLELRFSQAVKTFDSSRILLSDTNGVAVAGYTLHLDTSATRMELRHAWKDDTHYRLLILKDFATDSAGNGNARPDTIFFKTKAESEYGSVRITFTGLKLDRKPVLQWVQGDNVVKSIPLTGDRLNIPLMQPGEYKLRVLYDRNENGRWDTGDYWKKIQPEDVIAVPLKVTLRPNWDNELSVSL
ncbi:MAG: Ig-like domain-containing protein [Chitinophagaceae bacterium]|nr:Ig-like domain-containing protein [Chitinophagaceae bacterium]